MKWATAAQVSRLRVVKKLDPASRGAIKLAEQFGVALVCVRHRVDAGAQSRYTTVELLVGAAPIKPRKETLVGVRIGWDEPSLQTAVKAAGAVWDGRSRVWRMSKRLVGILRLTDRLVER